VRFAWIGLAAIALLALLTVSPYDAAPLLAVVFAQQRTEPAWVAVPPRTRVFYASEDAVRLKDQRSGRLDMFSKLSLPALKSFYEKDLAAKGFAVTEEAMGNFTPAQLELMGATGRLNGARAADGASITVSFAGVEGLIRTSRLYNVVWRIASH
jgi:hypothetical protein